MTKSIFLFVALLSFVFASAQNKALLAKEPAWIKKMAFDLNKAVDQKEISGGYYYSLIDHQVNIGTEEEYTHAVRCISNETGVQNASEISVTYDPLYQQVSFHVIAVRRNGQMINQLNAAAIKTVEEEPDEDNFVYNGTKRSYIVLKDVRKNDQIEYAYTVKGFNPVFKKKYSNDLYFTKKTAVANFYRTIYVPPGKKMNIAYYNNAQKPVETNTAAGHEYFWNDPTLFFITDLPSNTPSWYNNYPYVTLSEFTSWSEVAQWGLETFNNYQYPLSNNIRTFVHTTEQSTENDPDAYAEAVTKFVQDQVRYLGLEMGVNSHLPHPPSEVFQKRFGDCKDKALLLATLLNCKGLKAYVFLVNTEDGAKLNNEAPSSRAFDHAIVALERARGIYVFLDPTIAFQRGTLVNHYMPDYGYGLLLKPGSNDLTFIDQGSGNGQDVTETLDLRNAATGPATLRVSTVYRGADADRTRSSFAGNSMTDIEQDYVKFYAKTFKGVELKDSLRTEDDTLRDHFTVTENYTIASPWSHDAKKGDRIETYASTIADLLPDPSSIKDGIPVQLHHTQETSYTMNILSSGWSLNAEPLSINEPSFNFIFLPTVKDDSISLYYQLTILKDHLDTADIARYKQDREAIDNVLSYDFTEKGPSTKTFAQPTHTSTLMGYLIAHFIIVLIIIVLVLLALWLNKKSARVHCGPQDAMPIGGWTTVLGITIGLALLLTLVNAFKDNIFEYSTWSILGDKGGARYQLVAFVETIYFSSLIIYLIALLIWFVKRRDIFPRMFIGFIICRAGWLIILLITHFISGFDQVAPDYPQSLGIDLFRILVYAGVWVTYVLTAQRVKDTFVIPYKYDIEQQSGLGLKADTIDDEVMLSGPEETSSDDMPIDNE